MAASKVNIYASTFSYAVQTNNTALMYDTLIKFLVSGFPPLLVESITVTNKIARVVTTDKNFHTVPGVKMIMAGTGVPAIDDRQEIQEVFTDGFSFEVDTPDAVFTNGLTHAVAPLGWSLIGQSASKLLFKSGSGAMQEFSFIAEDYLYPSYNQVVRYGRIVYNTTSLKDIKQTVTSYTSSFIPFQPDTYAGYGNNLYVYWLYGDDAFVYICANKYTTAGNGRTGAFWDCSPFGIGELKPSKDKLPMHFVQGIEGVAAVHTPYKDSRIFNGGYWGTASIKTSDVSAFTTYAGARMARIGTSLFSGIAKPYTNLLPPTKQRLIPYDVFTSDYVKIGSLPGTYFVQEGIPNFSQPYTPQKIKIDHKKRNCLYIGFSNSVDSGSSSGAYLLLDLTGPIR